MLMSGCKRSWVSWGRIKHLSLKEFFFSMPPCPKNNRFGLYFFFFFFFERVSSIPFLKFFSPVTDRYYDLINSSLVYCQINGFFCAVIKI